MLPGRKAYWGSLELHTFPDAPAVVRALTPDEPVILNRPHAAARAARFFVEKFPGRSLYAVKANPSPVLLRVLWDAGITHYDVASIAEVRLVRQVLPEAELCFMHPVKTASAIAEAYKVHGVRTFSLDTQEELGKIVTATSDDAGKVPEDLSLCVRLRVSSEYSELSLASKFGCDLTEAPALLQATRQIADSLGICFHVGSQSMSPFAYVQALERVRASRTLTPATAAGSAWRPAPVTEPSTRWSSSATGTGPSTRASPGPSSACIRAAPERH